MKYSLNIDEELVKKVDKIVLDSNNKYKDRTQFIVLAIQEKLKKEVEVNE